MHASIPPPPTVAVVGPGALGKAYAFALAHVGARVVLVYRNARPSPTETLRAVKMPLGRKVRSCEVAVSHDIPACDVVLITLRNEDLDSAQLERLAALTAAPQAPLIVVLTPLLPRGIEWLRARLPEALLAVPTLAAEIDDGPRPVLRYWASALVAAPIEAPAFDHPTFSALVHYCRKAGLGLRACKDVAERGPATTIAFFPIQLALSKHDRLAAWPACPALMSEVRAALRQCRALACHVGPVEVPVALLTALASTRFGLWGLCRMSRFAPRLSAFLGRHFGHKLLRQHQRFVTELSEIAGAAALPLDHLQALAAMPASMAKT